MFKGGEHIQLLSTDISDWTITFIDTGLDTAIGERLRRVRPYLENDEVFLANYGDVLTDAPLNDQIDDFLETDAVAQFIAVPPQDSFHVVKVGEAGRVHASSLCRHGHADQRWLLRAASRHLRLPRGGDDLVMDGCVRAAADGRLRAAKYDGFWAPMDTLKERTALEKLHQDGHSPWAFWRRVPSRTTAARRSWTRSSPSRTWAEPSLGQEPSHGKCRAGTQVVERVRDRRRRGGSDRRRRSSPASMTGVSETRCSSCPRCSSSAASSSLSTRSPTRPATRSTSRDCTKMEDTVHLTGLRCDGQAHGGCQAGCLIYWKTDWLTRVTETDSATPVAPVPAARSTTGSMPRTGCTSARLTEVALGACRREDPMVVTDGPVYSCQATELPRAIGGVIPMWDVRQYVDDVRYGNAPLGRVLRGIVIEVFNKAQALSRLLLPRWLRIKGGLKYPYLVPSARQTPVTTLGLQAGDWVRVKSAEEIGKTLDKVYQNRGLYFDREMLNYCGRTAQVLRRVDQIVEETTGRMITMKTPCFILTDAVCKSDYHRSCPRGIYPYWREIWLERVPAPVHAGEMASAHVAE